MMTKKIKTTKREMGKAETKRKRAQAKVDKVRKKMYAVQRELFLEQKNLFKIKEWIRTHEVRRKK